MATRRTVLSTVSQKPQHVVNEAVRWFKKYMDSENLISKPFLLQELEAAGLNLSNPLIKEALIQIEKESNPEEDNTKMDLETFEKLNMLTKGLIIRIFNNEGAVPNIAQFGKKLESLFEASKLNSQGQMYKRIPYLTRQDPNLWGCCLYTVDGQILAFGDYKYYFSLQGCSRHFLYALALELLGAVIVHEKIGMNNWLGKPDSLFTIDNKGHTRNPFINAGALTLSSLIRNVGLKGKSYTETFDHLYDFLKDLAAPYSVEFDNTVYISEMETSFKNQALAYCLREKHSLLKNLEADLDYYFVAHSFAVSCEGLALMGATIANFGINPLTNKQVLTSDNCKYVLALMQACNLERTWSEKALHNEYHIHPYENMDKYKALCAKQIVDNSYKVCKSECFLFAAAYTADITKMARIMGKESRLCKQDMFGRTVLHAAASSRNLECIKYFLKVCPHLMDIQDCHGFTAMDDARYFDYKEVIDSLNTWNTLKFGVESAL